MKKGKAMSDDETETTAAEVTEWFFEGYVPTWVGVSNGTIDKGPEFILNYWGVPLYDYRPDGGSWMLDGDGVTGMLDTMQTPLKAHGFTHTEVVDRAVRAYHRNGAAIEVIWSRRRADDTEIERLAVHFEVIRTEDGWRVAGIQRRPTHADTLSDAWAATGDRGTR
jgi:hypothetical protein